MSQQPSFPRFRRRRLLVGRGLQLRFAILLLLQMLASLALIFVLTGMHVASVKAIAKDIPGYEPDQTKNLVRTVEGTIERFHQASAVLALPILVFLTWSALSASHRIAGPVHRLRGAFADLMEGRRDEPLVFRKKDGLEDLADAVNEAAFALQERRRQILETLERLSARAASLRDAPTETRPAIVKEMSDGLRELTGLLSHPAEGGVPHDEGA